MVALGQERENHLVGARVVVAAVGVGDRLAVGLHQPRQDAVSGDLYFYHRAADVDVFFGVSAQGGEFVDGRDGFQQRFVARAGEQRRFVFLKDGDGFVHQRPMALARR